MSIVRTVPHAMPTLSGSLFCHEWVEGLFGVVVSPLSRKEERLVPLSLNNIFKLQVRQCIKRFLCVVI